MNEHNAVATDEASRDHLQSIDASLQEISKRLKSVVTLAWVLIVIFLVQAVSGMGMAFYGMYQAFGQSGAVQRLERQNEARLEQLRGEHEQYEGEQREADEDAGHQDGDSEEGGESSGE